MWQKLIWGELALPPELVVCYYICEWKWILLWLWVSIFSQRSIVQPVGCWATYSGKCTLLLPSQRSLLGGVTRPVFRSSFGLLDVLTANEFIFPRNEFVNVF